MENLFLIKKALACTFLDLLSEDDKKSENTSQISLEEVILALSLLKTRKD